jgi:hypothetical protein
MKKLFLVLAVSGLLFASCGKKAEPVVEQTPEPQEVVAPTPEPTPEPTPAPAPKKKETVKKETPKPAETKTIESKAVDANTATQKGQVKTAPATQPKVLTLEEKLKIFDQLSPEEQKEVLRQVEEQKNGTGTKTKKKN